MKNKSPLFILFIANGISGFAQGISMLAIPWYFATRNHSAQFNQAYALITLLVMFFGLYAGVIVDKYSRKSNFLFTNLICAILVLAIALYGYAAGTLTDLLVVSVFGITMLNYNIHYPTLYAFGQEITTPDNYQRLNSNIELVGQSTSILSGAIAALLLDGVSSGHTSLFGMQINIPFAIAKWEIWEVFMLNATTYFVAALLIQLIPYTPNPHLKLATGNILKRIKVGAAFLKSNKPILIFGLFSFAVFAMLMVEIHAVLPGYIDRHLHEHGSVFALADGIYALGALSAGLFVGKVFSSAHSVKSVIILTLITVLIFMLAFATRSVVIIYAVSLILGFTNAGIRVLRMTYLFQHVPNEVIGRVGSIFNLANVFMRTLFILLFSSSFFDGDTIRWAYFIMAIFLLLCACILIYAYQSITKHTLNSSNEKT